MEAAARAADAAELKERLVQAEVTRSALAPESVTEAVRGLRADCRELEGRAEVAEARQRALQREAEKAAERQECLEAERRAAEVRVAQEREVVLQLQIRLQDAEEQV
jgi:hypothetical protein